MDRTPALLASETAGILPQLVGVSKDGSTSTTLGNDTLNSGLLLSFTGACGTVARTGGWPSGLEVDGCEARADGIGDLELGEREITSGFGGDLGVEERMEVGAGDVDCGAEDVDVGLPDVEGLGGGNWSGVSSGAEGRSGRADEGSELGSAGESVEDSLVTNNDELDELPHAPGDNLGDLVGGAGAACRVDVDTEDELDTGDLGGSSDVFETFAVGAVDSDGFETAGGDEGYVDGNHGLGLALLVVLVWRVGHGPLGAAHSVADATTVSTGGGR
jgi:hypothetical protein